MAWENLSAHERNMIGRPKAGQVRFLLFFQGGGRGRTRTYEGIASGFTVRPLCRSGHSPPKPWHRIDLERQSAPPWAGRDLRVYGEAPLRSQWSAFGSPWTIAKPRDA